MEIEGEERLVVVQEAAVRKGPESIVQSDLDELDALIKLISRNIVAGHELQAFAIVLIRKGTIPKTSSGKIQRHACRDAFLNRELYVLREWQERKQLEPALPKPSHPELDGPGAYGLASWVAQEISRTQGIDQERVDLNQPFAAYGLDSLAATEFVRVAVHPQLRRDDFDHPEQLYDAPQGGTPGHVLMQHQRFAHLRANGKHRIEGRQSIMQHHANLLPTHTLYSSLRGSSEVCSLQ